MSRFYRPTLNLLTPEQELRYMREDLRLEAPIQILDRIAQNFMVLQTRAGMLLSLITICLTISGFSGHRIAATGPAAAAFLSLGLLLAVGSAVLLVMGPLKLRWITRQACVEGFDATVEYLLRARNERTHRYHQASWVLLAGLGSYLLSVILFVLSNGWGA